ncbi:MAG: methylated-DNA--protein-cysteine methyltransferase [Actinomycetota bacterium]|nr:MAG: methylated-DNA--protein-cysteine methyltransferase [Actinomycetota bacterium]
MSAAGPFRGGRSTRARPQVALGEVGSPLGDLLVAVTARGLARVAFPEEPRDEICSALAAHIAPEIDEDPAATEDVRIQLEAYFAGRRRRFELAVDRRLVEGLAREVVRATARIPFGRTATYGELARRIGRPRSARAVGTALGRNPIPIVIPCHRVVRADGALGGYAGGAERKRFLLALEQASPDGASTRVD